MPFKNWEKCDNILANILLETGTLCNVYSEQTGLPWLETDPGKTGSCHILTLHTLQGQPSEHCHSAQYRMLRRIGRTDIHPVSITGAQLIHS